ncbi:MAG: RsmE family RNA methyltransferase [Spirochaetaceae bacterium]|nr:RsmE family RNA methyltransferase [Spirochaetaceae bacterium]
MKQFILNSGPGADGIFKLDGADYHYLVNVRRLRSGDTLNGLLASGENVRLTVLSVDKKARHCTLGAQGEESATSPRVSEDSSLLGLYSKTDSTEHDDDGPPVFLFQALPKGAKMDLIVRQAAECSVDAVIPFVSEYSVKRGAQLERWRRIVREARQQSGSPHATLVHPVLAEQELFALWDDIKKTRSNALGLIFRAAGEKQEAAQQSEGGALHDIPAGENPPANQGPLEYCPLPLHSYLKEKTDFIVLAIGPEGGFSAQETSRFISRGFKTASLGTSTLRTETAALCAVSAVRILLLEKDWWLYRVKESHY